MSIVYCTDAVGKF